MYGWAWNGLIHLYTYGSGIVLGRSSKVQHY
jgi:hypothetical protein